MSTRAQRARRIRSAQKQLHDIEEARLADLKRELSELETAKRDLISALNDDTALHGLFIDTMARRLRSLSEQAEIVGRRKDAQALKLLEQAALAKRAERLSSKLNQKERSESERALLQEILDRLSSPPP
ncbi:MAG: hypothetical protein F9K29_09615 [Hyphomicrobiaceae bacterium]|nr:MAG: hypothetical protein F9K29_09615 [Hyphomicrobiaceae bacterium]